ncbi:hypothetical protein P7M32_03450 [Bisgaard Taxon 10/6]|uniref:Uncharacterized protein n=1 Tax=Exercitatus varius TaxID=67857 RepID=A0ABT6EPM1_9PAST|nr:hypothetical protein [Exercitatus varius]MDG2940120.1 hypothetical protein [Exercitatus varius]MDG2942354.1 hypothetical protein [Exercitatus varius]MDG2945487.1 hypothetical protein [Exercitatus varius]
MKPPKSAVDFIDILQAARLTTEEEKPNIHYSTGFFLLAHHLEYPKGDKLIFYSLYRHTAELKKYAAAAYQ